MREGGIEVYAFLKVRFPQFTSKINYRNHRKIVVVDGQVGFVGGMNLAERYVRGVSWGVWRDTQLRVEGKAVHALQAVFLLDWYVVGRTLVTSAVFFPRIDKVAGGTSLVQVVTGSPVGPWREIMQGLIGAIHGARHYIYVQTPYFLPTDSVLLALQTAALSGVDVRLMLPRRADSRLTHYGSCSYLEEMLQAGVKVYFYKAGFLHSKMLVVDDEFSTVGSTNIDFRSFEHNFEVNAFGLRCGDDPLPEGDFSGRPAQLRAGVPEALAETALAASGGRKRGAFALSFAVAGGGGVRLSVACVPSRRCHMKKEKFTLPYVRWSTKCGWRAKSFVLPCSSTNRPFSFSSWWRKMRSGNVSSPSS